VNKESKSLTAEDVINQLGLEHLPKEGGYFKRVYYSSETIAKDALPARYDGPTPYGPRPTGSAIYYMMTSTSYSALHRLPTDELWHFYLGDPVEQLRLYPDGTGEVIQIGSDLAGGQRPMTVVPHGTWQSTMLLTGGSFALVGNSLAPGFENADYEGGSAPELAKQYEVPPV